MTEHLETRLYEYEVEYSEKRGIMLAFKMFEVIECYAQRECHA